MSTHDQTHESLDAYLAGGLTPDERTDIEAHIEICAECAQTVKDSRQLEQTMNEVFAKDRPDPRLEERAIAKLRKSRIKRATALASSAPPPRCWCSASWGPHCRRWRFRRRGSAT